MARANSDRAEPTKPARTILRQEITAGSSQLGRPTHSLILSAMSAGLDIGFGPLLISAIASRASGIELLDRLAMAGAYSIGFIIVILGRSELFTEHTTLAVLPLLRGRTTFRRVARLWALVYIGNLAGVLMFATLMTPLSLALGLFGREDLRVLTAPVINVGPWVFLGSAVAAGWLMGLVSWLVTAARDTVGQVAVIILVTGSIAFLGLHHSIAGSVEVLMGVIGAGVSTGDFFRFLLFTTIGNAIGGVVLVALLKYGHIASEHAREKDKR